MVSDDIEVESLEIDAGLLQRVMHVTEAVRHQREIARWTVDQEHIRCSAEANSGHLDRVNVLGKRRPCPRRYCLEGDARQDFGVDRLDGIRQCIGRQHALDRAGGADKHRLDACGQRLGAAGPDARDLAYGRPFLARNHGPDRAAQIGRDLKERFEQRSVPQRQSRLLA